MSSTEYEENEAREIRRQIEQFEVTILYDVTWNDHITHVISKAFASTELVLAGLLGLVREGEGLGPKRVEGRVMEKVNPFMDKAEELRSRNFPEGALQGSRAKKLFKIYWL